MSGRCRTGATGTIGLPSTRAESFPATCSETKHNCRTLFSTAIKSKFPLGRVWLACFFQPRLDHRDVDGERAHCKWMSETQYGQPSRNIQIRSESIFPEYVLELAVRISPCKCVHMWLWWYEFENSCSFCCLSTAQMKFIRFA